jgi:uncharacterized tellurite resistance protein B-like protein
MSKTLEQKIQKLQQDYLDQLKLLQEKQDWQSIGPLGEQLQKSIAALVENHQEQTGIDFKAVPFKSKYYRHIDCTIDLDHFVYDGDKSYFEDFLRNPIIADASQSYSSSIPNSKKELLKRALRLSSGMAPKIFKSIDRCKVRLGLNTKIDIYVAQNPSMNAYCYPSHEGCIYILVTSALLEKLNEDELTFVIGHEIGHYLYQHHLLNPQMIHHQIGQHLTPSDSIRLFSWGRNAELSADRIGLICCGSYEAACLANFKLSSGISSDVLSFSLEEYLRQYKDIEKELNSGDATMEDFYSSHPINPMRVISLDLFYKSETYVKMFHTEGSFEWTEAEMEKKIHNFMTLMEPRYLNSKDEISKHIIEFIFLGGLCVSSCDGEITKEELEVLGTILPKENQEELFAKVKFWSVEMKMTALSEQSEKVMPHISLVTRCNIIRDLTLISLADGELKGKEFDCLCHICGLLDIHPSFIDQVINSISYQEAA